VRQAWAELFAMGSTASGRQKLAELFRLCGENPLPTVESVRKLAMHQLDAWDSMAMGNYPYPSDYLVYAQTHDSRYQLPAFPVRASCEKMVAGDPSTPEQLLSALHEATNVFHNVSGQLSCIELPADENFDDIWDYQWCTEMLPQETYFTRDGKSDMFWPEMQNLTAIQEHCRSSWAVEPRPDWIAVEFGGTAGASNIVYSNGLYDPWSSGGVLEDVSESVVAAIIPEGAHHLDLMFSDPRDPASVLAARAKEMEHVRRWISERAAQWRGRGAEDLLFA